MPNQTARAIPFGTIIGGKYRVEQHVGDGGMGCVVAARHLVLNELYAIKFMHHRDLANPQAAARFVREAQAVVKLKNNEHVARVHDVGKHETGDLYIVMELLEGQDLGNVLKVRGVLPIHEACSYVLQACNALAEAHDLGIIHRDLKPANLFLTHRKDGSSCIKVLDFGISKMLSGGPEADVEMTGTRQMMGSPLYMSPEQAKSARDVDGRTDIWALGAILYKLLTGKAPFMGQSLAEVSFALLESTSVRPPSEIRRDIPRPLEACILRCLEKNVHRRYGRVTDLMVALAPFASKQSSLADDDDNAATVLRPMAATRRNEAFGGGTLPLAAAQLENLRSAAEERRQERSGTDVMPAYRPPAARDELMSAAANTNTTQPLDARALQALSTERRQTERKPSFTGRVMLPPVSSSTPNQAPVAVAGPQSRPANIAAMSGGMNGSQGAAGRITMGVPRPAIMPPPIPPAYPTGGYPIAPAARTTLPSASVAVAELPWNHEPSKKTVSSQHRRIASIALLTTLVLGGPIVVFAMRTSNPAHPAVPNSSVLPSLPPPKTSGPIPSTRISASAGQQLAPKTLSKPSIKDSTPPVAKPARAHE